MYGTATTVGGGLAVTGTAIGSRILAGIGFIFAGLALWSLKRKSSPVKP